MVMSEQNLKTRREFLRTTLLGGALTWTIPSFLHLTMRELQAASDGKPTQDVTGKDGTILVVLQLAGGNDGLNTVVPFSNDDYYRARPQIGLRRDQVLKLDDQFGLHPSLTGLQALFSDGRLAIVHGVGYPNPNRSHFRSMEIWQTASDADRNERYGWIGRYFDNACAGCDASAGISIGGEAPQAFTARHPKGITFEQPEQLQVISEAMLGERTPEEELFRQANGLDLLRDDGSAGRSINALGGARRPAPGVSPLDFLQRTALDAQVSGDRIRSIARGTGNRVSYPASRLAQDLALVGKLIAGGMTTRVYYVSHGGFDTHTNQPGTQERLLREFSDALKAFLDDLKAQGNEQRVLVMTFSEFGRRVAENASRGTDHGTAAPLFLAGGALKAGFLGKPPSLDPKELDEGDLKHTVDFRSVYATVLERHLRTASAPVLGRAFPVLDALRQV
jgi:uncharacterized protein (DUF1501 family)